eukprot:scaffold648442_cov42-Prasinocladus_malaysianus.AAC.1
MAYCHPHRLRRRRVPDGMLCQIQTSTLAAGHCLMLGPGPGCLLAQPSAMPGLCAINQQKESLYAHM